MTPPPDIRTPETCAPDISTPDVRVPAPAVRRLAHNHVAARLILVIALALIMATPWLPVGLTATAAETTTETTGTADNATAEGLANSKTGIFEDGILAYQAGDYETAIEILGPLADANDRRFRKWFKEIHAESLDDSPVGPKTMRYVRFAAKIGNPDAQAYLGGRYLYGVGGVDKDERRGLVLLQEAAGQDNILALLALGSYFNPYGPEREQRDNLNFAKSLYFFEKAAQLGDKKGHFFLGSIATVEAFKMSPDTPGRGTFLAYGLMWLRVVELDGGTELASEVFDNFIDLLRERLGAVLFTVFRARIEFRARRCINSNFKYCGKLPKQLLKCPAIESGYEDCG